MADSKPTTPEVTPELRQAWLTEYQVCEEQANATSTWLWTASGVFAAAWITGLGVAAAKVDVLRPYLWLFAGLAVANQVLFWVFTARSLQKIQYLFLRQRQIENELGMLIGWAITAADNPKCRKTIKAKLRSKRQQMALDNFLEESSHVSTRFEECLLSCFEAIFGWLGRGGGGRAPLYLVSMLVAAAWVTLAIWASHGR